MSSSPRAAAGQPRWHRPDTAEQQAIASLVRAAAQQDGVPAFGGHVLENLAAVDVLTLHEAGDADGGTAGDAGARDADSGDVEAGNRRVAGEGGRLVGAVAAPASDPAELVVHPDFRRRGHGGALLCAGIDRAGKVWAHGDLPAARSLAAAQGLHPVRTLLQLGRELPLPPELARAQWPDGVAVRTFQPGVDDEHFLAVNGRAFAWHPEQGRLDAAGLATEMAQDWFDPAGFFLAVASDTGAGPDGKSGPDGKAGPSGTAWSGGTAGSGGRVLGFHWTKLHREPESEPVGEVYVLGVDPQSTVRGLGTPLTVTGLVHLARRGAQRAILYVEGDNAPALRLYRKLGFDTVGTDVVYAPDAGAAPGLSG